VVNDIPTFEELKASGAPPVVPGEHYWMMFNNLPCCAHCGIVRRRDGKNKPCRGKVRVALRDASTAAERTQSDTPPPAIDDYDELMDALAEEQRR
jgi:hypothetical protein